MKFRTDRKAGKLNLILPSIYYRDPGRLLPFGNIGRRPRRQDGRSVFRVKVRLYDVGEHEKDIGGYRWVQVHDHGNERQHSSVDVKTEGQLGTKRRICAGVLRRLRGERNG